MKTPSKQFASAFVLIVAMAGWVLPGAGYFILNERKRAFIVFIVILLTFLTGLYIGSLGVIDPVTSKLPYIGQIMNSPVVFLIAKKTAAGAYPVYGEPCNIGQIYTSTSGLLNLLCIVNAAYLAYLRANRLEEVNVSG